MNSELLLSSVVREMAALLAEIATADGQRSPLGALPERLFAELARELEARGVGRKVAADTLSRRGDELRARVLAENVDRAAPVASRAVTVYVGQSRREIVREED